MGSTQMKIVLSRKGFDQGSGGGPSPVFADGSMVSLPIPDGRSPFRYADVTHRGVNWGELVADLSRGQCAAANRMHLDPDLRADVLPRLGGWLPAFGQVSAAQKHLENRGIGPGDLFLFFGWFAEVDRGADGRWRRKPGGLDCHMIHGWMTVGEILKPSALGPSMISERPWLRDHPHAVRAFDPTNTIYVADLEGSRFGSGVVDDFREPLVLSAQKRGSKSVWRMPRCLSPESGRALSYHVDPQRWTQTGGMSILQTVGRGQEFVIDVGEDSEAMDWIGSVLGA